MTRHQQRQLEKQGYQFVGSDKIRRDIQTVFALLAVVLIVLAYGYGRVVERAQSELRMENSWK